MHDTRQGATYLDVVVVKRKRLEHLGPIRCGPRIGVLLDRVDRYRIRDGLNQSSALGGDKDTEAVDQGHERTFDNEVNERTIEPRRDTFPRPRSCQTP